MKTLCLMLLAAVCSAAPSSRIVNGQNSDENEWPWQLSLEYEGSSGFNHICGAVLISAKYALTAAHCIDHDITGNYRVVAGQHDRSRTSGNEQVIPVGKRTMEPGYDANAGGFPNDIAVLELTRAVELNDKVGVINLPHNRGTTSFDNMDCIITGWGILTGGGSVPNILQEAFTKVLSQRDCRRTFENNGWQGWLISGSVNENFHICIHNGNSGACNGDSGGPLVCKIDGKWELAGVTSWGMTNCPVSAPSVYTRVSNYIDFIQRHS